MLLLSGAAGMAWLLTVEPVIKTAASAAITMPVFIASPVVFVVRGSLWGEGTRSREKEGAPVPVGRIEDIPGSPISSL